MVRSKINFKLDPSKVERARNITPASKFAGRNITDETPIITDKIISCIAKQLTHSEYLQRIDAIEKIGNLAEKGADIKKLIPALESASEDYNLYVRDAAKKTMMLIKQKPMEKKTNETSENVDLYPFVNFRGYDLKLIEALMQNQSTKKKAIQKIENIARHGLKNADHRTKVDVITSFSEIVKDEMLFTTMEKYLKAGIEKTLKELSNDPDGGIRSVARLILEELAKR